MKGIISNIELGYITYTEFGNVYLDRIEAKITRIYMGERCTFDIDREYPKLSNSSLNRLKQVMCNQPRPRGNFRERECGSMAGNAG